MDSYTWWAITCSKSTMKTLTSVWKRLAVKTQIVNQLTGFYIIPVFIEKCFQIDIRTTYEICWTLTIKTPDRRYQRRSGVFFVNFEQISHLVFLSLKRLWTDKRLLVRYLKITFTDIQNNFHIILFLQRTPTNDANK